MVSSGASSSRKKVNRSPLRARAQQQQGVCGSPFPSGSVDTVLEVPFGSALKMAPVSPDHVHLNLMNQKSVCKDLDDPSSSGAASPAQSYLTSAFMSKPNTPRDASSPPSSPMSLNPSPRRADHDWQRIIANGRGNNDGTHLIRVLADFIEDFQFSKPEKGEHANGANDSNFGIVESRHSHQLAGQLRRLADAFDKENFFVSPKDKNVK
ncbi:hypothetical protein KP509_23G011600 [Ceratopteris richardii]|uniref:Uncharacterized protein n=1 Tax=Ceratopteris richardii TaxID=49495 RepID=A0A8T2RX70_CERRI|nr:hypothetical protein KP509_23G011600 [Ceratopteris richardii]